MTKQEIIDRCMAGEEVEMLVVDFVQLFAPVLYISQMQKEKIMETDSCSFIQKILKDHNIITFSMKDHDKIWFVQKEKVQKKSVYNVTVDDFEEDHFINQ